MNCKIGNKSTDTNNMRNKKQVLFSFSKGPDLLKVYLLYNLHISQIYISLLSPVCYRDLKVVSIITSNELTTPAEVTRESQQSGGGGGLYYVCAMLEI